MLVLNNVQMRYPSGTVALEDINLKINRGEFIFLVGSSGAGKSTFIKLITKEIDPTAGSLYKSGFDITRMHKRRIPYYRRSLGIVFQDYRLLNNETVYENVAFAMRIIGKRSREIKRNVPLLLNLVGLSEREKHFPMELYGGEQQRVAIARAVANNPDILICDEPTGNLDPETSWELIDLLMKLNRYGATIIMATHQRDIVDVLKKRVIELDKGRVVRDEDHGGYH
ncbi:MAG TPA: cell division ATP-binding protein FtsE [Tissierellia bacterium]|nr:cell division ATP-binding protein FtsE [Tissierellia bacterium]